MRLRTIVFIVIAATAMGGGAQAQLAPSNTVVTPRLLTPDTPRFHAFVFDDTVATCSPLKKRKRPARPNKSDRNCLQQN